MLTVLIYILCKQQMKPVKKDLWLECRCGHIFIPRIMTFLFFRDETQKLTIYSWKNNSNATAKNSQLFSKLKVVHLKSRKYMTSGYMVFCYQNCSDLLREKIVLVIEKNFWNSRLKAENFQNFWDHLNNLFKQWKVRTIFGNRMLF